MTDPTEIRHEIADETRTVQIPESLAVRVERRLPATQFESTDAYITFCLTRLVRELEREEESSVADPSPTGDDIRDRLESLGYL